MLHEVEFSLENVPAAHAEQLLFWTKEPAAQDVQVALPLTAVVPRGHRIHELELATEYWPPGQGLHSV